MNFLCIGTITEAQAEDNFYYGMEFSPNGKLLYVGKDSLMAPSSYSYQFVQQFQVDSSDIGATEKTIWQSDSSITANGHFRLGPDGKIYVVHATLPDFPQTLSVIHSPDSIGLACDFQPYSLSLAPYNSTLGLPNIPNYRVGPLAFQVADAGLDRQICLGDSVQIGIPDTSSGQMEWVWWPATGLDDPGSATPKASPSTTTTYYLTATDTAVNAACATTLDSVTVTVLSAYGTHVANAGMDSTICLGESAQIGSPDSSGGTLNYQWSPSTGLDDPTISMPLANPLGTTTYYLTVTDPAIHPACRADATDSVTITIDPCIEPPAPEFLVQFYPNPTDGNSILFIQGLEEGQQLTFELWNMLGQRVIMDWNYGNGTHDVLLNMIESGIYFYRIWQGGQVVIEDKIVVQK